MKFVRRAKVLRGPINAAPVAGVVMLLLIFMLLMSLLHTPGVLIHLPVGNSLTVSDNPTVVVAVDSGGQCFFENKPVSTNELNAVLKGRLQDTARQSRKLTMVLYADKAVKNEVFMNLESLAAAAGVTEVLIAGSPPAFGPQQ
jgi:biopolymer transport protein ExbD